MSFYNGFHPVSIVLTIKSYKKDVEQIFLHLTPDHFLQSNLDLYKRKLTWKEFCDVMGKPLWSSSV